MSTLSTLPLSAPLAAAVGFFAAPYYGVSLGVSLSSAAFACGVGGCVLWVPALILQKHVRDFGLLEMGMSIASAGLGAHLLGMAVQPIVMANLLGISTFIGLVLAARLLEDLFEVVKEEAEHVLRA